MVAEQAGSGAAEDGTVIARPLGEEIDAAIRRATGGRFWGAVLVAGGGEILLARGYGFADYARMPNTPRTLFEIASTSKMFTAAAIVKLEAQGRLKTSDPISQFFPETPRDKLGVTVHHLLTHTAGISPELGVAYDYAGARADYVHAMLEAPLETSAGETFAYANVGYALLAAIVEEVTGGSFEDYVRRELFAPAGMTDTGFVADAWLIGSPRVSVRRSDETAGTAADWFWGWGYRGMGGVITTVYDLLAWHRALQGETVLNAAAKAKLYTPFKGGYAYGWLVRTTDRGTRQVEHGGGVAGFTTHYVRYLDEDAVVAVISNEESEVDRVARQAQIRLFPPPRIELDLDISPYPVSEYGAVEIEGRTHWRVGRKGDTVTLRLHDSRNQHALATLRFPSTMVARLLKELDAAIGERRADDPGTPASIDATAYLGGYELTHGRARLAKGLDVTVMPLYLGTDDAGREIIDKRATLVVSDGEQGGWPIMVLMNLAAAEALADGLRTAG